MEAQPRITANLGLPEYWLPGPSSGNGQPYQVRVWTYRNPTAGEDLIQVVEYYDGACWRADRADLFAHKNPRMKRNERFDGEPTNGFLLLENTITAIVPGDKGPESADQNCGGIGGSCSSGSLCSGSGPIAGRRVATGRQIGELSPRARRRPKPPRPAGCAPSPIWAGPAVPPGRTTRR